MTPFSPEGLVNPILSDRVFSGQVGANGLPSGHANLDGGHPSLL